MSNLAIDQRPPICGYVSRGFLLSRARGAPRSRCASTSIDWFVGCSRDKRPRVHCYELGDGFVFFCVTRNIKRVFISRRVRYWLARYTGPRVVRIMLLRAGRRAGILFSFSSAATYRTRRGWVSCAARGWQDGRINWLTWNREDKCSLEYSFVWMGNIVGMLICHLMKNGRISHQKTRMQPLQKIL